MKLIYWNVNSLISILKGYLLILHKLILQIIFYSYPHEIYNILRVCALYHRANNEFNYKLPEIQPAAAAKMRKEAIKHTMHTSFFT